MRYEPKAPEVTSEPNVIPMADIMLVLLIIFMVVAPLIPRGVPVDLAAVNAPVEMRGADKDDAIVLSVRRDGTVYLGMERIAKETITAKVRDLVTNRADKTVFVKSDGRARYSDVVVVVDGVRAAGVDQLGLITEKKSDSAPPPPPAGRG